MCVVNALPLSRTYVKNKKKYDFLLRNSIVFSLHNSYLAEDYGRRWQLFQHHVGQYAPRRFFGRFFSRAGVQACAAQRLSVFFAWVQPSLKYFVLEVLHILRGFAPAKQACKRAAAQLPPVQFIRKLL